MTRESSRIIRNPERDLWQSVLLMAIEDALTGPKDLKGNQELRALQRRRACTYVTRPSKDLSIVCGLAGVDMEALIDRMMVQISALPAPKEIVERNHRS